MLLTEDANDLLASKALDSLTALDLSGNQIDAGEAFRSAHFRLRELDISGTQLGATGLDRLLGSPSLADLRVLRLNRCGSTTANMQTLAASPFWAQAEELHMEQGMGWHDEFAEDEAPAEVEPTSLTPLLTATGSKTLRVLDVSGTGLRDAGVALLCQAAWTESLTDLDLSQNYLSDAALAEIARSNRFRNLRRLHLNFNSPYHLEGASGSEMITDAGLRALADSPHLANLRVLSLSGTRITAAGVEAVLNSPHWRLSGLRLSQCQLRSNVIDVLVNSPRLARLELLDLSANDDIEMSDLEPLAESEYLCPLTVLHVRGLYAENPTIASALRERLGHRFHDRLR
jgi:Leucine-rich repeat (LRR) protein